MHNALAHVEKKPLDAGDTFAGNISLSAAILFSGATPGKIFHPLHHMQVASISERTFYYHQSNYL